MKRLPLLTWVIGLIVTATIANAAGSDNFAGEFADKNYLNGQAVVQASIEQAGNSVSIFFTGGRKDGQGCAPEINATGTATNGTVRFKFLDSEKNSGTGTISRAGDGILVSIKPMKVADARCLGFYRENMRLQRVRK
jgi:hypothetical protein